MKTRQLKIWRWLGAGLLVVLCAGTAAVAFVLGTASGRAWLADRISMALSADLQTVRVEGLRVAWPLELSIERATAADPAGVWLEIRAAECRWAPLALRAGPIEIRTLRIATLGLARLPAGDGAQSKEFSPAAWPKFLAAAVELGQVRLASAVCGFPVELADVRGRVEGGPDSEGTARIGIEAKAARAQVDKTAGEHLAGAVELGFARDRWAVSGSLAGDGFDLAGKLEFPGYGAWPTGTLRAEADGASGPAGDLWPELSAGRFVFSWDCPPRPAGLELAQADLSVAGLQFGESSVQAAHVQAQLRRSPGPPALAVAASARLENYSFGSLSVTGAEIRVAGPWGAFDVSGTAAGTFARPFALDAAGRLTWDGAGREIKLTQAAATWAGAQARLTAPLQVRIQGEQTSIQGAAKLEPFDLTSVTNVGFKMPAGRIAAEVRLGGTLAAPEFEGEASGEKMAAQAGPWSVLPPVQGACRWSGSNGTLHVSAEAQTATRGAEARVEARVPARISLVPWAPRLDPAGDLAVDLRAGLNLALLNEADFLANSRLGGRIDLSVAHVGSVSSGAVTGTCALVGGEYENYALGTVVRAANVKLVSRANELAIESGSATDGGKGTLALSGSLRPNLFAGLPCELELDFRKARLLRRPDAEATVSGTLALTGTVSRLRAAGDFQLDHALVDLRNLRPPPPAELEAVPPAPSAAAGRAPEDAALALRLAISIPGSLYVRSGTLDTAWAGNLVLERNRGDTGLSGYLEPRRGTILLLKRPFKLDEGRIDFDGRWPPDPGLRLTAVFSRPDLSARARITGPARDPDVALTSEPPLPEDEILSQILFGENMSSLTPLQAISLATEASKLRKFAGGGGVLGGVPAAVGIDRVELRENGQDSAAPEVALGKYVGERSYVEMRRGAALDTTDRTRLYLEHELRPNVVLEAESGLEMRSGVGLFWKRDY
jgi:translocation and assembly module TamB